MAAKNIKGKRISSASSQMPTHKIIEILNSPNTTGIDGHDYSHVRHELESEYWRRMSIEDEKQLKHFAKLQDELFRHLAKTHKRSKAL